MHVCDRLYDGLTGDCSLGSPGEHEEEADKVEQKELVVSHSNAVVDPGTVVIKSSHASVTCHTVLGTKGTTNLCVFN